MGAKFSPSLANLYMGWWERHFIYGGTNPFRSHIRMFKRYIDDLIFIMDNRFGTLENFLKYLNDNDRNLQFTGQSNNTDICFLNVHLCGHDSGVQTSLDRKPLSGNTLLIVGSGHPCHTIKGTPVGQFFRVHRICSDQRVFEEEAEALYLHFIQRGYPKWMLDRALFIVRYKDRNYLFSGNKHKDSRSNKKGFSKERLMLSTPFSLQFEDIRRNCIQVSPHPFRGSDLC